MDFAVSALAVCCDDVMAPFAREILAWLAETGAPIPLILDDTPPIATKF